MQVCFKFGIITLEKIGESETNMNGNLRPMRVSDEETRFNRIVVKKEGGPDGELLSFAQAIIESIQPTQESQISDDVLSKLGFIFPENLILAALDLIDRENVTHYTTDWGHSEYEVLGSTATYSVFVDLRAAYVSYSCTCPAFASSVLLSETHIMCKHILATLIGRKLARCIERSCKPDDLAAIYCRQFPLVAPTTVGNTTAGFNPDD